jgi:glycosyltransferase involved in cell wall biosynthesis
VEDPVTSRRVVHRLRASANATWPTDPESAPSDQSTNDRHSSCQIQTTFALMSAKPGILFLVSSLVAGGAERHAISLLNNLDLSRFRLSLGYLKPPETLLPDLDCTRLERVISLNVQHKLDMGVVRTLADYIDRHDIGVVVSTNAYPTLYAALASRRVARRPRAMEVFHSTTLPNITEQLQMGLYRFIFRRQDLLVYVSQLQQNYWRAKGLRAKREIVIHNGIDPQHFFDRYTDGEKMAIRARFGFLPSDYVIGICSALRPEKAHGDFLEALSRLRRSGIDAKGLIIGDGPERSSVDTRIHELGLQERVVAAGFQADVRPFVAACDVMTLTSHSVETFSLAALESMSLCKPMVMTNIGGAEEQVIHGVNGLLFSPGDVDALIEHLTSLATADARARMGSAAGSMVREKFTLTKMVTAYAAELLTLAASSLN